ncbi:type I polyketide synthase [Streptomyces sp. NBC_00893]|uniref:type I polyketide synthase n=1 Tax=Streptomyces sp. NBC_00893 TaxID=2975862 RepID=UPI00224D9F4E|nr:type I polyketide synthase [Streptomyces sp. NBC_00893]MCX4849542.1 SDR family NAD(P)-dependent oxidoreductase [Streptomyces sp. NBC_00893]
MAQNSERESGAGAKGAKQSPLTRAMDTIKDLRRRLAEQEGTQPIAVVGMGLRLPGGISDLDGYWEALATGRDLVTAMPETRKGPFAAEWEGLPQRGGFLDEVLDFDADHFGISPREARHLDPQHRLLLEVAWEAMEDAGLRADRIAGTSAGIYLGIMWQDFRDWLEAEPDVYATTGNGHNFAAGRIAYALGLDGPALSVDTACSSSLVAVHLAVQALRRGECEVAFAAGANLIMSPRSMRLVQETRSLAPDGLCKTFDARANGFTRGEGCGVLVLKRLDHAVRDQDRVHAVLHGSAVNQDGRSGGFTAPNVLSQVALTETVLAQAGLGPSDIGHVEAHGTGTALGDPIEMEALAIALGRRNGGAPLPVGAVKTNFGHLESAAGVAGLIKAALCLRHGKVPPVVHFRTLNPRIDLTGTGITVPSELMDWDRDGGQYAAVSSFGMSGTNAQIVLGRPPAGTGEGERAAVPHGPAHAEGFEISARTDEALRSLAGRYADRLAALPPDSYAAFAYTATHARTRHDVRVRIAAADAPAAVAALRSVAAGTPSPAVTSTGDLPEDPRAPLPRDIITLPAYPWQRRRYAPGPAAAQVPAVATPQPVPPATTAYRLRWESVAPAAAPPAVLVVGGDDTELAERTAREAAARGVRGTLLTPAAVPGPDGWERGALPRTAEDWRRFWNGRTERHTLLLAPLAPGLPDTVAADRDPARDAGALCDAVTVAVTALAATGEPHRAFVLTRGARRTADDDRADGVGHGPLHGLAPVLGLELRSVWGGVVDLPSRPEAEDLQVLLAFTGERDAAEAAGRPVTFEDLAAVRGGRVLVARLTPAAAHTPELTVRGDATYLVTGGLGAVGRELTADLARRGARHLLLVGRRPLDALGEQARALLDGLRASGTDIAYQEGGCDTPAAWEEIGARLRTMPPVRGVLHAAGTLDRLPVTRVGAEDFTAALRAKYTPAWWLHLASRAWPLDFFVLVSSVSAIWGTEHCAAYSAANGALDTLAAHRRGLGLPAVSLAYGPWDLDGAGMADDASRESFERAGVAAQDSAEACAALTAQVPGPDGHIVSCRLDAARFTRIMSGLRPRGLYAGQPVSRDAAEAVDTREAAPAEEPEPSVAQELAALPEKARAGAARAHVSRMLGAQLGHQEAVRLREDVGFLDLGLDSIMAVDLAARLAQAFGTDVAVADVFDHPTVTELADHLLRRPLTPGRAEAGTAGPPARRTVPTPTALPEPGDETAPREASGPAEPVAIVGMAGRFPGADSVEELWHLLSEGRDGVGPVPEGRWDTEAFRAAAPDGGTLTTDQGGFLRDLARFDASFFGIPAREAENLDPQQRLLLESTWHALEDGGIDPHGLKNSRTGVFVGVSSSDYARVLARAGAEGIDAYYGTGTALNAAAGRIAYTLGLHGPALAVDTACSSSLVALHLAVRSLRSGETDAALAGGVNVLLDPLSWVAVSRAHMLSPDGRCRTFSADANGFVRSEGCGVLVLKRLSDARRDGNRVLAVIRGSAVNQDGASSGLTAPSGSAQEAMLRDALADGGVEGSQVSYLEAHGTGTAVGDPIELGAGWRVLGPGRKPGRPLHVGSVKSNIGHCESAAGMAGVIKTVLALRHGCIPANLHFDEPNPLVPWADMYVRVVDAATPWRAGGTPRFAGVSGFGFTGTNAHVLLSDDVAPDDGTVPAVPDVPSGEATEAVRLLPLSAPDPESLERLSAAWAERLTRAEPGDLAALTATAGAGRAHFPYRRTLWGASREQLLSALDGTPPAEPATRAPRVAFLFSGQGSQHFGMGRELYETEPVFRGVFDACDLAVAPTLGASLVDLVLHGTDTGAVNETRVTQPALVALEIAVAALWESWGVTPAVVMGHSVGEIAAALHAGVMDLPTGMRLIADRSRLMQGTERGAMLAVTAPEERVLEWIEGTGLDIAAVNTPDATVVSGLPDAVAALAERLKAQGVRSRALSVSHAFHSRLLDPVLGEFARCLAPLELRAPALPVVANLTGDLAGPDTYDARYWREHARNPVRFHSGARRLAGLDIDLCLEIGPDRTLVNLLRAGGTQPAEKLASSLRRGRPDRTGMLTAARTLYERGQDLDWRRVHAQDGRTAAQGAAAGAPRHPFGGRRYWPQGASGDTAPAPAVRGASAEAAAPPWGVELRSPVLNGRVFRTERSTVYPPHLTDHRLFGTVSVPGASQTATVLSALGTGGAPVTLEDLHFPRALVLREGERYELQITDIEQEHGTRTVGVVSLVDDEQGRWQEHLSARVVDGTPPDGAGPDHDGPDAGLGHAARDTFVASADRRLTGDDFYRHLWSLGYHLGPSFRWIREMWIRGDEALVRLTEPQDMNEPAAHYEIHPGLLDSCLQSTVGFAVGLQDPGQVAEETSLAIPFAAARVSLPGRPVPGGELWGHVRAVREAAADFSQVASADLRLCDEEGTTVLAVDGFRFRRAPRELLHRSLRETVRHAYAWEWTERPAPVDVACALRVTVLGTGDAARAVREAFAAAGHHVSVSGGQDLHGPAADLIVDARFCVGATPVGPRAALAAVVELARSLRAAPTHVPYAVLGTTDRDGDAATAPLHEALRGLLASLSAEQLDRRLLSVALAGDADVGLLVRELSRSAADGFTEARLRIGSDAVRAARLSPHRENPDRTGPGGEPACRDGVLITGGLGALGLSAARILARQGATALTLMGRSDPGPTAREAIARLTANGTRVTVIKGDVTDPGACRAAVAAAGEHAPLRTVLHLAGTTADRAFEQLTEDDFEEVFAAKAFGAMQLTEALRGHDLDAFVLFSSASSVLGSAGQANYAAANGFLDGLATVLRAAGVPATSVNWGPWVPETEGGLAASGAALRAAGQAGIRSLTDDEAAELLGLAMTGRAPRVVAVSVDRQHYTDRLAGHPGAALFRGTGPTPAATSATAGTAAPKPRGWLHELLDEQAPAEREQRLAQIVREMAGAVLGDGSAVVDDAGFSDLGLDSIMVIDLRSRLSQALGVDLAATIALDHPTVTRLARHVADLVFPAARGGAAAEPHERDTAPVTATRPEEAAAAATDPEDLASLSFEELVRAVQADVRAEKTEKS